MNNNSSRHIYNNSYICVTHFVDMSTRNQWKFTPNHNDTEKELLEPEGFMQTNLFPSEAMHQISAINQISGTSTYPSG